MSALTPVPSIGAVRTLRAPTWTEERDLVLDVEQGRVAAVGTGTTDEAAPALHGDIALPAPGNSHDHGRGLPTLGYGASDARLESWLAPLRSHPRVDPFLFAAVAFGDMAAHGVGSAVHCHTVQDLADPRGDIAAVARAARTVGIRLALAVPVMDRQRLGYGVDGDAEAALLAQIPAELATLVRDQWLRPGPTGDAYVRSVEEVAAEVGGGLVEVQFGPVGAQWCSDDVLAAIAAASAATGRRVHMHLLETRLQRQWADAAHPEGLLVHLDRIGLLSERLTVAHGVWLRPDEIALLGERGVSLSLNASSNLRLRSGIAPAPALRDAGVRLGIGLDGLALDDDHDILREARLAGLLHGAAHDQQGTPAAEALGWACGPGSAPSRAGWTGTLDVGQRADVLLLSAGSIDADATGAEAPFPERLVARATGADVRSLVVDGRLVVVDGRVLGLDLDAARAELSAQAAASEPVGAGLRRASRHLVPLLDAHYAAGGHERSGAEVVS